MKIIALLLIVYPLCRIVQNIFTKRAGCNVNTGTQLLAYTAYQYLLCTVFSLSGLLQLSSNPPSLRAVLFSIAGGIAIFSSSICTLMALRNGVQFILTSLFATISIMIPIISSIFLFGESMSIWKWIGSIALVFGAFYLLNGSRNSYRNLSVKKILLLCGILVAEGLTALSSKAYAMYAPQSDVAIYTSLSFGTAFVFTGTLAMVDIKKSGIAISRVMNKQLYVCGLILSIMLFIIIYISTVLAVTVPAVILYSVASSGNLILALFTSIICFKEPVTQRNVFGLVISIIALVVINV